MLNFQGHNQDADTNEAPLWSMEIEAANSTVVKRLSCSLKDASLLRGVPASVVLSKCGRAFSTHRGPIGAAQQDYQKSCMLESLDEFISHDWRTSRLHKVTVLLLLYNGNAAVIASFLTAASVAAGTAILDRMNVVTVSVLVKAGTNYRWTPTIINCSVVGFVTFWVFLLFWQNIREALWSPLFLFVDKLCVDQVDEGRKAAAIRGLAAFLKSSRHLVVCWTPFYFTRLWTMYELASWRHLTPSMDNLIFEPTWKAVAIIILNIWTFASVLTLDMVTWIESHFFPWCFEGVLWITTIGISFAIQHHVKEVTILLPQQLASFSMSKAQCFCCSNNHLVPQTGQHIECDRELIYHTLTHRFASRCRPYLPPSRELQKIALLEFDEFVRGRFAADLIQKLGAVRFRYREVMLALVPGVWALCGFFSSAGESLCHCLVCG